MTVPNILGAGTYTNLNNLDVVGSGSISSGNNLTLQVIDLGAVGQYIDFTINGSYINSTRKHTLSVTGNYQRQLEVLKTVYINEALESLFFYSLSHDTNTIFFL